MRGRGRGRGGARGRGRGRGSGRGRSRGRNNTLQANDENDTKNTDDLNINIDVKKFFIGNATVEQHYNAQNENKHKYVAGMVALMKDNVSLTQNARVRGLTAAWARHDFELASALLSNKENFGLPEILKALEILDAGRQARILEKRVKLLQVSKNKVKPKTIAKLKLDINNLNAKKSPYGSASGAICKHIRQWTRTFTKEELEFFSIFLPKEPWKKLADICHFNPEKDFPNLPWFLRFCFGDDPPSDTIAYQCKALSADNINTIVNEYPVPYSQVKQFKDQLTNETKGRIAGYEAKVDTVLWWYEHLQCEEVDKVLEERIAKGEKITLPDGKFIERMLTINDMRQRNSSIAPFYRHLVPIGQERLDAMSLPLDSPIAVMGDASSSMEVAIKTSSIIAGLLSAISQAKLSFFNTSVITPDRNPESIEEVLKLAVDIKATSATNPGVCLDPYYKAKEIIKTIIMVTDEEENTYVDNQIFADLFEKYYNEVYPAKMVFVSFLHDQHAEGQMVSEMKAKGFEPLQFKFHRTQPDLTKLDKLFGLLSSETETFDQEVNHLETKFKLEGISKMFDEIKINTVSVV